MQHPALPVAIAAAFVVSACSRPDTQAKAPAAPPAPNVVTFTAADYAYTGPDTIPAGLTTIRLVNSGKEPHHIFLVKLKDGKTAQDLGAAMTHGGPLPDWAVMMGGPNAAEPGDTIAATIPVDSGNYVFFCVIPSADGTPHMVKGMMRPLTAVPSAATPAPEPTADIRMTLVDYSFQLNTPITAGRHTIRYENTSAQPHEVVMVKLQPGKTMQDWVAAAEKMNGPLPGTLISGMSGLTPGQRAFVTHDFTPGDYGIVCFVPDAKDGKPHFLHGMIQQLTIS